ncbi:hypothetical protein ACJX0J_015994, partial [Zea mays]
ELLFPLIEIDKRLLALAGWEEPFKSYVFLLCFLYMAYITREEHSPMKIIDFGLSDFIRPDERLNDIVGSAYYVAPEVLHSFTVLDLHLSKPVSTWYDLHCPLLCSLVTSLSHVEAKKRYEFLEAVSAMMDSHLRYFKQGYELLHQMEPYINQVRSLTLDVRVWEPSVINLFQSLGNMFVNSIWEETLPDDNSSADGSDTSQYLSVSKPKHKDVFSAKEKFIHAK